MCYWSTCTTTRKNTSQSEVKRQPGSLISIPLAFQVYYALIFRISKGFRAPGLRNLKSRACQGSKVKMRQDHVFFSYHDLTDPKVWKVALSFSLRCLICCFFFIFVPILSKQQTHFNTFGVTGFTANVLRAPGSTVK